LSQGKHFHKFFLAHPFSLDYFPLYQGNHGISSANGKHADFCECTKEFQISNNHVFVSVLSNIIQINKDTKSPSYKQKKAAPFGTAHILHYISIA